MTKFYIMLSKQTLKMSIGNKRLSKDLKIIKLSFSFFLVSLLAILPVLTTKIINNSSQDTRSAAEENTEVIGPIQSWIVSPNGQEIVYGNTEIQFFAKNASENTTKFGFKIDLLQSENVVKNLFTFDTNNTLTNRDGIYSVYYDFTGLPEANNYRLKLTTKDGSGQNVIEDYSDNYFTISPNNTKPEFISNSPVYNLKVGDNYNYNIEVKDNLPVEILPSSIPEWLNLDGKTLSGIANELGIFSVVLVAVNSNGRQSSQMFSLSVESAQVIAEPTSAPEPEMPVVVDQPTTAPTQAPQQVEVDRVSKIKVILPDSSKFTKTNTTIKLEVNDEIYAEISKIKAEISRDGTNWEAIYEGRDRQFDVDLSKYEGGKYSLRFVYEFKDGSKEIKNVGPVEIIKQDSNIEVSKITINEIKPLSGAKIEDRKPIISGTFLKPAGTEIDLKKFKLILDNNDLSTSTNLRLNPFTFSYVNDSELDYGKHEVSVEIALENGEKTSKTWSFEIKDPNEKVIESSTATTKNVFLKNKTLLGIVIGIILLIFILSIWAIALSRKEKNYYAEEKTYIE